MIPSSKKKKKKGVERNYLTQVKQYDNKVSQKKKKKKQYDNRLLNHERQAGMYQIGPPHL